MIVSAALFAAVFAQDFSKRFEYQFSFKGPYITQTDGTIPFWSHHGHAIASDENVRLVPSLRSRQGSIWSKKVFDKDWWEVEVFTRVSGRGKVGADGMAIWYTVEGSPGDTPDTTVFGSRNRWMGLGIFLDSFDNDGNNDNPKIMAFANDGTKSYDHANDGGSDALFSCRRDFRNKPYPARLKIRYYKSTVTVFYHAGVTEFDDYEYCGSAENVVLEKGYFGLSAATGGLSDDHDVMKFLTHSITDPESPEATPDAAEQEEVEKLEEEMKLKVDELNMKFSQDKASYIEDNPDMAPLDKLDIGNDDPQLQLIFTVQNHIQQNIKTMAADIAGVKQMIDMLPSKITPQNVSPPVANSNAAATGEVSKDIQIMNEKTSRLLSDLSDLRQELAHVSAKIDKPKSDAGEKFNEMENKQLKELQKSQLNDMRKDLQVMMQKMGGIEKKAGQCPSQPEVSCVSSSIFVLLTLAQIGVIGFLVNYKMSQEAQAKKFF